MLCIYTCNEMFHACMMCHAKYVGQYFSFPPSFPIRVVLCFHPCLVSILLQVHHYLQRTFYRSFPLSCSYRYLDDVAQQNTSPCKDGGKDWNMNIIRNMNIINKVNPQQPRPVVQYKSVVLFPVCVRPTSFCVPMLS